MAKNCSRVRGRRRRWSQHPTAEQHRLCLGQGENPLNVSGVKCIGLGRMQLTGVVNRGWSCRLSRQELLAIDRQSVWARLNHRNSKSRGHRSLYWASTRRPL